VLSARKCPERGWIFNANQVLASRAGCSLASGKLVATPRDREAREGRPNLSSYLSASSCSRLFVNGSAFSASLRQRVACSFRKELSASDRPDVLRSFPLRLQPSLTRQPVRFEAFVVLLELWLGLTVRYRLSRRHRIESPSIGFVRNLLLGGSLRFDHLLFTFSPSSSSNAQL
jgi:hypothetical protein